MSDSARWVVPFRELDLGSLDQVGGKNASLGEMIRSLGERGVRVPDGFAVTADAYRLHLAEAGLEAEIHAELDGLDVSDVASLQAAGASIRERIRSAVRAPPAVAPPSVPSR